MHTPTINKIDIEDIVFDIGIQNIRSNKHFLQDVIVEGSVEIENLNGRNLRENFEHAILLGEPVTEIQGNLVSIQTSKVLF